MKSRPSVRDMTPAQRRRYSLSGRIRRSIFISTLVMGLASMLFGAGLLVISLGEKYVSEASQLAEISSEVISEDEDPAALAEEVLAIYRSLSEEERAAVGTEAYREKFAHLEETENFKNIQKDLKNLLTSSAATELYIGYYDKETQALVYICDANDTGKYSTHPGDWEQVSKNEIREFWKPVKENSARVSVGYDEEYGIMCTSGVQACDAEGQVTHFVLSDVMARDLSRYAGLLIAAYAADILIFAVIIIFLMTGRMQHLIITPLKRITAAARAYTADRRKGVEGTKHFSHLKLKQGDEIEELALTMGDMEDSLVEFGRHMKRVTAERERIATELDLAKRIQTDMLPSEFPAFPERHEFDIYATSDPAREVGGDFYDFYMIDEDHMAVLIADVSGKGIPAALFMMMTKIIMNQKGMDNVTPADILADTNDDICVNNKEEMFVTVWLGILEISTGQMICANAGHERPVIIHNDGEVELLDDPHGFVLGGLEGMKYKEYDLSLKPGDKLFVYTDGVPEATDAEEVLFGSDRMLEALSRDPAADPEHVLENVQSAVNEFVGEAVQFDDLTMLCLEYRGPSKSS